MLPRPSRAGVWLADLDPTRGHEQAGTRPVVIVSADRLNASPAGLVIAAPITTRVRRVPWHVSVLPPEGGLREPSFIMCEAARSISTERLIAYWGTIAVTTMVEVEDRLRVLLRL